MNQVYELRQYTLFPGRRDELIDLFDAEFIETQEDVGMEVVGQFRDLDGPDRFVWVRGFADMAARAQGLRAFYGGPVWAAYRDAANATMIDSDDVLLLSPASPASGFPAEFRETRDDPSAKGAGSGPSARPDSHGLVTATVYSLALAVTPELLRLFEADVEPLLKDGERIALLRTEPAPNNFPALPVREGENVLVRFARWTDHAAAEQGRAAAAALLAEHLLAPPHELRLEPTDRSKLR
ncbi:NIPSNAP family protein [Cryptosporangium sp. NPDC048952]|uniref:NIPSNAP family protein n=1 Tax=Cryptosporangium sp. NPDC048952 TaxID=3363961 RepID=UPI00371B1EED